MNRTILLIDDEPQILKSIMRALRPLVQKGIHIYTSPSAPEAIPLLQKYSIDLVVTDENMDEMKGTELLAWLMEHSPKTRRIVLTGDASLSLTVDPDYDTGVDAYLLKPFKSEELLSEITAALKRTMP